MDLPVGIDMVRCRFRFTAKVQQSVEDWPWVRATGPDRTTLESGVTIPVNDQCNLWLGLRDGPKGRNALLGVNPSRIVDPSGTRAVGTGEALGAVEEICPLLEDWIFWDVQPVDWDLYRLDLTVDVEIPRITQQVLTVAERGLRSPRQKVNTYRGPSGDLETVRVARKTKPNLSIYDKAKQSRTGPARVRFEVQLDRTYLRANFARLGDLTDAALRQCFQAHFSKVIDFLQADDKTLYDLQLSGADKKTMREIVGYETLCEKGYTETLTRSVRRRFDDFHKRHSIRQVSDLL